MPLSIFRIRDRSMEPAVRDGDYVLVSRLSYLFGRPKEKDIVVLRYPGRKTIIIKRISKIRDGSYLVLGDNRSLSVDSRTFGPVRKDAIIGKVISVIRG
ncbi:MAG TPA: nickel-type superoxide dismutase maturation protease [Candidatus Acidoferrum sp.]|nr:nickel-type superoxide dismutase maturation protease [Candidatus Acidoferrum sp.]